MRVTLCVFFVSMSASIAAALSARPPDALRRDTAVVKEMIHVTEKLKQSLQELRLPESLRRELLPANRDLQTSPWICNLMGTGDFQGNYECYGSNPDYFAQDLSPNAVVVYICSADLSLPEYANALLEDHCVDILPNPGFCGIIDLPTGQFCSSCTLLPTGELAYNCESLYGSTSSTCSSRNDLGECGQHDGMLCLQNIYGNGLGWICNFYDLNDDRRLLAAGDLLPLVPSDISNQLSLQFWCENPVFGRNTLNQCGYDYCTLQTFPSYDGLTGCDPSTESCVEPCEACKMLLDKVDDTTAALSAGQNILAYDCASMSLFQNQTVAACGATYIDGECVEEEIDRDAPFNGCASYYASQASEGDKEKLKSWTLTSISARTFNVASGFFALVTRALVGLSMALAYPLLVSWHLQRPNKRTVPLAALDAASGGLLSTAQLVRSAKGALPTVFLFVALAIAEFSHPVADIGLDFPQYPLKGTHEPVLSLRVEDHNLDRPLETMGDPISLRTDVYREVDGLNPDRKIPVQPLVGNSPEVDAYMVAVELIGEGLSPFTSSYGGSRSQHRQSFGGVGNINRVGIPCDGEGLLPLPLAEIPLDIPLTCESGIDSMVQIPQIMIGMGTYVEPLRHVAAVPNCTFSATRPSGIFQDGASQQMTAQILETVTFESSSLIDRDSQINIIFNGEATKVFTATPEDKRLARDRQDWKHGRRVTGIQGMQIGNITVPFGAVVVATGREWNPSPRSIETEGTDQFAYRFFAQLNDTCPDRPSGFALPSDTACFAFLDMACEPFQEDDDLPVDLFFVPQSNSQCDLLMSHIIWGRNFEVNDDLLATMAGIYGRLRPSLFDSSTSRINMHIALAALFALGSLVGQPSIRTEVRPRINTVYITSMMFPLFLTLICLLLILLLHKRRLPIPGTTWEFLVFGRETPGIPVRRSKRDKFPPPREDLHLEYAPVTPGSSLGALVVTGNTMNAALQKNANMETPVEEEETMDKVEPAMSWPSTPGVNEVVDPTMSSEVTGPPAASEEQDSYGYDV